MKKIVLSLLAIADLSYVGYAQNWSNLGTTPAQSIFRSGKVGIGTWYVPDDQNNAWYGQLPGPQLEVSSVNNFPSNAGSKSLIFSVSGSCGTSNTLRHNTWLFRNASGGDWLTTNLHDGISIDNQHLSPMTNTKTWWDRNPFNDVQLWGHDGTAYMRLAHGKFALGTNYNPDEAAAWYLTSSPQRPAPPFEVFSGNSLTQSPGDYQIMNSFSAPMGTVWQSHWLRHNNWIVKTGNANSNFKVKIHDGITYNDSYTNPGVNTLTWWEREPDQDIQSWGSWQNTYMTLKNGHLIIGKELPASHVHYNTYAMSVNGVLLAKEVVVTQINWPDFVFEKEYKLAPLSEVEAYYKEHHHLPAVPSAKEIIENGSDVGKTDALLLQKIEELTLYVVELQKQVDRLNTKTKN